MSLVFLCLYITGGTALFIPVLLDGETKIWSQTNLPQVSTRGQFHGEKDSPLQRTARELPHTLVGVGHWPWPFKPFFGHGVGRWPGRGQRLRPRLEAFPGQGCGLSPLPPHSFPISHWPFLSRLTGNNSLPLLYFAGGRRKALNQCLSVGP